MNKTNARPSRQERAARMKQELKGNPALDIVHPARFAVLCSISSVLAITFMFAPKTVSALAVVVAAIAFFVYLGRV